MSWLFEYRAEYVEKQRQKQLAKTGKELQRQAAIAKRNEDENASRAKAREQALEFERKTQAKKERDESYKSARRELLIMLSKSAIYPGDEHAYGNAAGYSVKRISVEDITYNNNFGIIVSYVSEIKNVNGDAILTLRDRFRDEGIVAIVNASHSYNDNHIHYMGIPVARVNEQAP